MAQLAAANKAANAPTRFTAIQRSHIDKTPKIDIADIIRNHTPNTGVIDKLKKATGPFYLNITPEICLDLLKLNDFDHNRDLNWKKIHNYYLQMVAGEWCNNNGDTIRTSTELQLLDGQNRLVAAYMAKFTLEMMIIAPNCPPKSFAYIDIGENRSASDMATINGFGANKGQVAYAVKAILLYEKFGQIKSSIFKNRIPNYEVNRFMQDKDRMSHLIDDIIMAKWRWMKDTKDFFTAPQWATAYYILRTLNGMENKARKFMDQFASGNELSARSPIRAARRHFENEFKHLKEGKHRNTVSGALLTIKINTLFTAWNHEINKESVGDIKIDAESKFIVKPNFR
jgi:hypothetical protein